MANKDIKLELEKFLQQDAARLISARELAFAIHHAQNISTAGDEVEIPVRKVLKDHIPSAYVVGQGHIVDAQLTISPQCDIVVADALYSSVLFKSENETSFFPYETIYAIGEVKSSYVPKHLEDLTRALSFIHGEMTRKDTKAKDAADNPHQMEYANPLFSFYISVNSDNLDIGDLKAYVSVTDPLTLPNIMCFLDKGVLVHATEEDRDGNYGINLYPKWTRRIERAAQANGYKSGWCFIGADDALTGPGANLTTLLYMLIKHMAAVDLGELNMFPYLQKIFPKTDPEWLI